MKKYWKLGFSKKITKIKKNTKNTKFSYVMHYGALLFIEEITDF